MENVTMGVLFLACLLLAGVVTCDEVKSYRGHHVLSAKATTEQQVTVLSKLEDHHDVVYIREPSLVLSTILVVPPEQKDRILDTLKDAGIDVTVQSTDLQAAIDAEKAESRVNRLQHQRTKSHVNIQFTHNYYRNLTEVYSFMRDVSEDSPSLVNLETMERRTHEGRSVYYLQVEDNSDGIVDKPVIFIEGLAHAREWITTASLLYAIDETLRQHRANISSTQRLLQEFTWIIIPAANPDGYVYTWTKNRMWRKNVKPHSEKPCKGVDLNRNYDVKFGGVGVSKNCRSEIFPGEAAFSEVETRNVRDLFMRFKSRVVAYLSVHAFSQLLLYPWSYSKSNDTEHMPPNVDRLRKTGLKMTEALKHPHGKTYTLGTAYHAMGYATSGSSIDWALQEKPGIYAYCYELRPDRGLWEGFMLPADQIVPTGQEMLQSVAVLADTILEERQSA